VPGQGKGVIQAKVHAECDTPPRSHRLRVWLEKQASDGKTWFQNGTAARFDDIPSATGRDFDVSVICIEGYWRVRVTADGSGPNGHPFDFTLPLDEVHVARIPKCLK
jgi:hypothetical protein